MNKQRAIAVALLPTLREELEHVNHDKVICRPRELEVRATCGNLHLHIFVPKSDQRFFKILVLPQFSLALGCVETVAGKRVPSASIK